MKDMGEMLLRPEAFSEIVIGNTALVRAMVESRVEVVTSYPGSPTPEIAAAIAPMPIRRWSCPAWPRSVASNWFRASTPGTWKRS